MIKTHYLIKTFRDHLTFLAFACLLVGGFQLLILSIISTTEFMKLIEFFMRQLPPHIQNFFNEEFLGQFSINGIAAFGYNHPIVLILFAIVAITPPTKHLGNEIEEGTLELLFSLPVKRLSIAISLWIFSALALFLLILGGWLGTIWGIKISAEAQKVDFDNIFLIGLNLWLLMMTINAYTFLLAAFSREGSKVAQRAAGITLFFYFLNYATKIWPAIQSLKYLTVFNYFQPLAITRVKANIWESYLILSGLSLVCLVSAFWKIDKRDIP